MNTTLEQVKSWAVDVGIRAVKTAAQSFGAAIVAGQATGLTDQAVTLRAACVIAAGAFVLCIGQNLNSLSVGGPTAVQTLGTASTSAAVAVGAAAAAKASALAAATSASIPTVTTVAQAPPVADDTSPAVITDDDGPSDAATVLAARPTMPASS